MSESPNVIKRPEQEQDDEKDEGPEQRWQPRGRVFLVGFLRLDEWTRRDWTNRLTAWWTGSEIFHAEMYFHERDGGLFGLTEQQPAQFKGEHRRIHLFGNRWLWVAVEVSPATYERLVQWCRRREQQGVRLDRRGFYCLCVPGMLDPRGERYLCSGLVATALTECGVITPGVSNPASISPAALREYLTRQPGLETREMASFQQGKRHVERSLRRQERHSDRQDRRESTLHQLASRRALAQADADTVKPDRRRSKSRSRNTLRLEWHSRDRDRTVTVETTESHDSTRLFAEALLGALYQHDSDEEAEDGQQMTLHI